MKYFLIVSAVLLTLIGCSSDADKMTLSGHVKGLKKGTLVLQKIEDTILISVDSVEIDGDAAFTFSEKIVSPEVYYLHLKLNDGILRDDRIAFFAENSEIHIESDLKNFGIAAKITGSENNDLLNKYKQIMNRYADKNLELIEQRLTLSKTELDSLGPILDKKQKALLASKYLATINYAINKKDFEVAPYLMLTEVFDANIKYLDTVYGVLTPKIKDSKYGKDLESFIKDRKETDTIL